MPRTLSALVLWLVVTPTAFAGSNEDAKKAADTYLAAITGEGDESGKELLLGGATMNAQLFSLENYRYVSKEPVRREEGDLASATQMIAELDRAGKQALSGLGKGNADADGFAFTEVSAEDASKLMEETKHKAAALLKAHPVLAYVARVDKQVYWHPKNPIRQLLGWAGKHGRYTIELHNWKIETKEGPRKVPRIWPLRLVRFKSDKLDSGWKVIPASDWNAE